MYAGNFALGTTNGQVLNYLRSKFPQDEFAVEDLPKRESAKSVSFKITTDSRTP